MKFTKELGWLCSWKQYGMCFAPKQLRESQNRRRKGWQKRELFRQSMCWKKELQQGRRLQACRTASGYEVQRLRFQLLRDRPVQWRQSTDGQQLLFLGMRSSSLFPLKYVHSCLNPASYSYVFLIAVDQSRCFGWFYDLISSCTCSAVIVSIVFKKWIKKKNIVIK